MELFEELEKIGSKNEQTTISSITYLPSTLGAVKAAIGSLAQKKKDWDIEILGDDDGEIKEVVFEDSLSISVPVRWWGEFSDLFGGNLIKGRRDLSSYMKEAMEDKYEGLKDQIKPAITELYERKVFDAVDEAVLLWKSWFSVSKLLRPNVPITVENKFRDIQRITTDILRVYERDIGNLELLIEALKEQQPLNAFEVFKDYDFIYGSRAVSVFENKPMTFEVTLDMSYLMAQSVAMESEELAAEFDNLEGVKVVKNVLFPTEGSFTSEFFETLKEKLESPTAPQKEE